MTLAIGAVDADIPTVEHRQQRAVESALPVLTSDKSGGMMPQRKMEVREIVTRPVPMLSQEELRKVNAEVQSLWDLQETLDWWLTSSEEDNEQGKDALQSLLRANTRYKKVQEG